MKLIPIFIAIMLSGCTKLEATDTEKTKALATKRAQVAYLATYLVAPAKIQRATNATLSVHYPVQRVEDADGICYLYQNNISCLPKANIDELPERSN